MRTNKKLLEAKRNVKIAEARLRVAKRRLRESEGGKILWVAHNHEDANEHRVFVISPETLERLNTSGTWLSNYDYIETKDIVPGHQYLIESDDESLDIYDWNQLIVERKKLMGKDEAPLFIDWYDYETDGSPLFSSWDEYVEANLEYFKYAELDGDSARGYALIEIDGSGKPKQVLGTLDCYPEGDAEVNTYIDEAEDEADADAEFEREVAERESNLDWSIWDAAVEDIKAALAELKSKFPGLYVAEGVWTEGDNEERKRFGMRAGIRRNRYGKGNDPLVKVSIGVDSGEFVILRWTDYEILNTHYPTKKFSTLQEFEDFLAEWLADAETLLSKGIEFKDVVTYNENGYPVDEPQRVK